MADLTYTVVPSALTARNWACAPEPSARRFAALLEPALAEELRDHEITVQIVIEEGCRMGWRLERGTVEQRRRAEALTDGVVNAVRDTGDWVVFDDAF